MNNYKIAIMGEKNTGKNTLSRMIAKYLRVYHPSLSVKYLAFADPIKEMAMTMFPTLPRKFFYGSSKYRDQIIPNAFSNGQPLTIRQLLIDIGTHLGRTYQEDIWLDNFDQRLKATSSNIIIVPDVRRINEINHLQQLGFYLVRLSRQTKTSSTNLDISETEQRNIPNYIFNCMIDNNKNISHLREQVENLLVPNLLHIAAY